MIHFSCMYCGRKIRAQARLVGRKAPCPARGHVVLIPKPAPPSEQTAAPDPPAATPTQAQLWEGKSNKEIANLLLRDRLLKPGDRERAITKAAASPLLPRYDELTLFALSVTFLLLLAINPRMHTELSKIGTYLLDEPLLPGAACAGLVFSLFSIFVKQPKPEWVKWPMLAFAVTVTAGTGAYAGYVMLKTARGWLLIFPAWNVINGLLLLLLFCAGVLDSDCILDRRAKFWQVVLTLLCVSILLGVCEYGFQFHWALTYSICVGYTMSLHHALTDVFGDDDDQG